MVHSLTRYGMLIAAISLALVLTGCATPVNRQAMTPQEVVLSNHYPYSVHVQTNGGSETSATGGINISDADLKAAIEDAVIQSKVFKSVVQSAGGDFELNVRVVSLSKPIFGLTFTVEMETAWSLIKVADHSVVMRKSVKSRGTATTDDAFLGATRLRLAVENAARENINQGLKAVAELSL
jgi:hypothetical protein